MALILAALYLLQGSFNADASPLSIVLPRQTSNVLGAPQECICPNTRSRWDIIWSCLATIFVCTWVSVHPNIPALGEPWWKKVSRRVELMFWSIIAPELIINWAIQQWFGARQLVIKYKEYGWTMSHGYFIQMGGFMLYNNDKPIGVLDPAGLDRLVKEDIVAMPRITEQEIQDRSKSDGLSKALVVIQTTWFIGQCIARRAQGLIITELELATLAFAAVNGVMYMFWWSKPLDVQTTIRVDLLLPIPQKPDVSHVVDYGHRTSVNFPQETEIEHENPIPSSTMRSYQSMKNSKFQDICSSVWWLISGILLRWPVYGIDALVTRVRNILNSDSIDKGAMGVPTFYAPRILSEFEVGWEGFPLAFAFPFVGILFGAIHLAGWNFSFPSLIEANIWRVSSSLITSVPVIFVVFEIYAGFSMPDFVVSFIIVVLSAALLLYIVARLALLVVALTTLRDLPLEALSAVEWTSFLPHI
ncbi:hypothetical protein GALMADRAFT_61863 [Galerina marginata CBS 339.88]|uniref:Uncharacterized protein n=1 Tax=Galerina marginata (strain CBS 339.88) TaxID=685588 RepID=A0A067TL79_GALM3|nr:hypothetical protein GALMADRAFT_61863 [Galerina marginata CBS 339.88]